MPSPHLGSYRERVQLDGKPISEAEFAAALESIRPGLERVVARLGQPTEFEILTALALSHLGPRADRLVIEVGMGGRLDTTNVLDLGVAVITNVSLDHQQYLGSTVAEIAAEKAAIIKPGNTAITGAEAEALAVVEAAAQAAGARLWRLGRELRLEGRSLGWEGGELSLEGPGFRHRGLRIRLLGRFQLANAALAVAAAEALGDVTPESVAKGLEEARWPGRLELAGGVILDGAHNPAGMRALAGAVAELGLPGDPTVVFAAMADKDVSGLLEELRALRPGRVIFTKAAGAGERGADPERLAALWGGGAAAQAPAAEALAEALRHGAPVLVCGSLYLVGELRQILVGSAPSPSAPPKDLPAERGGGTG